MSSIKLSDVQLNIENITGKKKGSIICSSIDARYARDKDGKVTDMLEGWNVNIPALGGAIQAVKLPLQARKVIDEATAALERGDLVLVTFNDFKGSPYAIISEARMRTGVSCTASGMQIRVIPVDTDNDDEDEEIIL